MSYRRRRGLGGGGGSWLDRLRGLLPGGGPGDGAGGGEADDRGRGWRRAAAVLGLVVLLFGAGYLISARWLFPASSEPAAGDLVRVPDLVGLERQEARRSLDEGGLTLRVRSEVPHREAPQGAVLAQSPLPDQYARPGAPVAVTLSLGPESRRVPDLRGLSDRQGRIVLERLGFGTRLDTAASRVERGRVVGTRPESGTALTLPAEVTVVVSEGPSVADVPDLTGLHVDDVEGELDARDLRMGEVEYDPEAYAAPGRVVGQSPPPGYALRTGGRVSVRVAGPPPADSAGAAPADSAVAAPGDSVGPPSRDGAPDGPEDRGV